MKFAGTLSVLLSSFCLLFFNVYTPAQQKATKGPAPDWDALTPKIKVLVQDTCYGDGPEMWIGDSSDLIGDGTPLASVECSIGAYMDAIAFITLENGEPVMAKFRDGGGKPVDQNFIDGASVLHGAATVFIPTEHAIVQIYWGREDGKEPTVSDCAGTAYFWNRRNKTFDIDPKRSPEFKERECRRNLEEH
jgi:hypothetical protein